MVKRESNFPKSAGGRESKPLARTTLLVLNLPILRREDSFGFMALVLRIPAQIGHDSDFIRTAFQFISDTVPI
jgi:hypothetical protein